MNGEGVEELEAAGALSPADVLQAQHSGEPEPEKNAAGVSGDALVSTRENAEDMVDARERDHARASFALKLLMSSFMLIAAACGAYFAYKLGVDAETQTFQEQYYASVTQLSYSLQRGLSAKAGAGAASANYFASAAGGSFPNVSFPSFNAIAASLDIVSQVRGIAWLPLVLASQLKEFEAYANETLGSQWADATLAQLGYVNDSAKQAGIALTTRNVHGGVFAGSAANHTPVNASAPYYFPLIHEAPLHTNEPVIMYDLNSEPLRRRAISDVLADGQQHTTDWIRLVQDTQLSLNRIASLALTPVFFNGTIVGLSNTVFNWDSVLLQALPSFINGIDAVLSSQLSNRTFTMRIISGAVIGVGEGDQHESDSQVQQYKSTVSATLGTTWTLTIYPTVSLINSYRSNGPRDRCVAVVIVILSCLILFGIHDYLARSRSLVLARIVAATQRIVDDVFPKTVRARLMKQAMEEQPEAAEAAPPSAAIALIQKWVGLEAAAERDAARRSGKLRIAASTGAIADVFPATTVLFADIAGFTAWSASKPPERVFFFLGTLFRAFDELAHTYSIFKVETVGDSYMAVCGLPEPTPEHALRMADFSLALLEAMADVCREVGDVDLQLRVGLHSGSCVAGVLLGERARFQLFGDTVNTASRMESTGAPGRVQVSQETARLLHKAGCFALDYRGKVEAKGKGSMDTFWLLRRSSGQRDTQSISALDRQSSAVMAVELSSITVAQGEHEEGEGEGHGP